jgi:hypothetical protein
VHLTAGERERERERKRKRERESERERERKRAWIPICALQKCSQQGGMSNSGLFSSVSSTQYISFPSHHGAEFKKRCSVGESGLWGREKGMGENSREERKREREREREREMRVFRGLHLQ